MDNSPTILIVDDDRDIRELLAQYLKKNGLSAVLAENGTSMWTSLQQHEVELVVLDIMMPGDDGLTLCRALRERFPHLPVIMLTARGDPIDRIIGLELGADDYIAKPFEPRELLARLRSVLRRTRQSTQINNKKTPRQILFAGMVLDLQARHLITAEQLVVALSGAEWRMLNVFLEHPHQVLSREQLICHMQSASGTTRDHDAFDRSIDLLISRLRQKLGDNARAPALIKTIRHEGYALATNVERE